MQITNQDELSKFYLNFESFVLQECPVLTKNQTQFGKAFLSPLHCEITTFDYARCKNAIVAFQKLFASNDYQNELFALARPENREVLQNLPNAPKASLFQAFDFHLGPSGPKLIEVNTNAGFGLGIFYLNQFLKTQPTFWKNNFFQNPKILEEYAKDFKSFFSADASALCILDENPTEQALYFEFLLFRDFLSKVGIDAIIAAPEALSVAESTQSLIHTQSGKKISGVYNRSTDFYLHRETHAAFKKALISKTVFSSPHPLDFYLFADKQRMVDWNEVGFLKKFLGPDDQAAIEKVLLKTQIVSAQNQSELWAQRKALFFKPFESFGGKGVFQGRGVTKNVWEHICQHHYIAQEICPAPKVSLQVNGAEPQEYKFDLRFFVYGSEIRFLAPRFYQGQTTNFRTPLGGFGAVCLLD